MGIKWIEDYSVETQRVFGLGIGFAGGATSAWIVYGIYTSWAMFKGADWWDVLMAFGTVGAVFVALYLASKERRLMKREKKELASLHAAEFAALLSDEIIQPLNASIAQIVFAINPWPGTKEKVSIQDINEAIRQLRVTLEKAITVIDVKDLVPIIGLGKSVAHRAAYGLAQLGRIEGVLRKSINRNIVSSEGYIVASPLKFTNAVLEALRHLSAATLVCRNASYVSAPTPSDQEVYGDYV
ncbi:hypothetical protein DF183_14485 [Alcaligenes faecalis]|uniref:Uncharacterized protein n=1 Tax=Alcaligenes faecalis TaxID=511 RepID=A0A2U2BGA1_ALCFA|nr:hypothetical protein DF183_14485 [Alcaligenes faecalis]